MRFADLLAIDGVEEVCVLRSRFGFMAFHGGALERVTDEIATLAAERSGASLYAVVQPEGMREHLPSTQVRPEASPLLAGFLEHVDVVVAVHGYGRQGFWTSLLLGGTNRDLARHVGTVLRRSLPEYVMVDDAEQIPAELRGMHPDNPCNGPRHRGVQLELPPRIRGLTPHAAAYDRVDGRIPPTEQLIDALAEAARTWPLGPTPH